MSFDWTLVNVAISIVAVYLTFSLLASWINEQIAAALNWRSGTLSDGILKMLDDAALHRAFYGHPLIDCAESPTKRRPSYISADQFSMALIGILTAGRMLAAEATATLASIQQAVADLPDQLRLKGTLIALLNGADGDYVRFRGALDGWFNDQMDRVNGWYRRLALRSLFIIGALLALALNVDTIKLIPTFGAGPLTVDCAPRSAQASEDLQCVSASTLRQLRLGWSDEVPPTSFMSRMGWVLLKLLGLALTACALALGAPFWFDVLKQLVNVRNAGLKPAGDAAPAKGS